MNRILVFIVRNGIRASHGTMIVLDDGTCITSHSLTEGVGFKYFVSFKGSAEDVEPLNAISEVIVPLRGTVTRSIAPYIYQISNVGRN